MEIKDNKKIIEIQREFNEKFPYLKLEFYKSAHEAGEGSPEDKKLDPYKTVAEVRTKHKSGDLSLHGNVKVETLEHRFEQDYGLHVQVYRKSGDIWLQTTATDSWTLSEQNDKGAKESI